MKKFILMLFMLLNLETKAQDTLNGKCWTPEMDTTEFQNQPWYSNNDYLENFLDSIGYPSGSHQYRIIGAPEVRFWIPIKFWIYRDNNGNGGPSLPQIQGLLDDLNRRFNQTNNAMIGFYMKCDPTYINNTTHVTKTFTGASLLMAANNDPGSFNVHIIGNFASAGTAGFSIPFLNASMIPSGSYLNSTANGDLAHEIGHLLGLSHTHQYSAWNWRCLTECVSRTRTWPTFNLCPTRLRSNRVCEATGDGLRDTQADNNLINNSACFYNVSFGNDPWGDSYDNPPAGLQDRPDVHNIMSYNSATDCVDHFSRLQIGVMLWTLYHVKLNNISGWTNPKSTFDNYEPDNDPIMARNIQLNERQERNFHQQWNRIGGFGYSTQCDVDWVSFTAPCTTNLEVFTGIMEGRTSANTRLTLFNSSLAQLAQNDDISSANHFSSIHWNFISGQQYFIRIENMSPNTTGYYTLKVGNPFPNMISISGNTDLCPSGNYMVNGLPAGATVSWSAWPLNMVSFSCTNCPVPTITPVGDGAVTITATVSVSICGTNFTKEISKQLFAGVPDNSKLLVTSQNVYAGDYVDLGVEFEEIEYCSLLNAGVADVQWDIVSSYPFSVDAYYSSLGCAEVTNSGRTVSFSDGYGSYTIYIRVKVMNACGWSGWSPYFPINVIDDGWGFKVSPNPSSGSIMITLNEASIKNKKPLAIREIQITDKLGNLMKKFQYGTSATSVNLNIHDLKQDVYFIRVFNGKEWKIQSIIKK